MKAWRVAILTSKLAGRALLRQHRQAGSFWYGQRTPSCRQSTQREASRYYLVAIGIPDR